MRVKCIKHKDGGRAGGSTSGWLTIGKEYDALCVYFDKSQGTLFRLIADDRFTPALFECELFDITDSSIPQNWVIAKDHAGVIRLGPKAWLELGYWEKFFDGDPEAKIIFERERQLIEGSKASAL